MKKFYIFLFLFCMLFGLKSYASVAKDASRLVDMALGAEISEDKQDIMYQISVFEAYKQGYYKSNDNKVTAGRNYGDFGIGLLKNETGALLFLGGEHFKSKEFTLMKLEDKEYIPIAFGFFKYFDCDDRVSIKNTKNYDELSKELDKKLATLNYFTAIKAKGHFNRIDLEFSGETKTVNNLKGTLIGFRMPDYYKSVAPSGYVFYFIDDTKAISAKVKDIDIDVASFSIDYTNRMEIILPKNRSFKVRNFAQYEPKAKDTVAKDKKIPAMQRDREKMMATPKGEPTPEEMMQMFAPRATF